MAKNAWLAVPIAVVVLHRLAWVGGATTATTTLLFLAAATFAALVALGLILRRLGVRSPALGIVLAALFWLSAPTGTWPDWIGGARIDPDPIAIGPATQQRDLTVIMVDDYPTSLALLVDHGYDNAEFQLDLSNRGFDVVPEAWSNSSHPLLAIATTLAGRYPGRLRNERDRRTMTAMVDGDNPVADLLHNNGYTTTHVGAPSAVSVWFGGPDQQSGATFDDVVEVVDAVNAVDVVDAPTDDEKPEFVFAHISGCDSKEAVSPAAPDPVTADALCKNRAIGEALDHLETETVVVVAGTRGARIDDDLGDNPDAWPRSAMIRGLGVFSAIRFPPDCLPPPDDATVATIVHHAVACALGVEPDPLPERAVLIKGDLVDPDDRLEVNLNVLRSDLSGQNLTTTR